MRFHELEASFGLTLLFSAAFTGRAQPTPHKPCHVDISAEHAFQSVKLASGASNTFTGGNVILRCRVRGEILRADSVETYGDEGRFFFIGHVDYKSSQLALTSDFLTYFQREERLLAVVNMDATLPSGSRLKGPSLEFFRAIPRIRPQQRGIAIGRPTITLVERDAQGRVQPPATVTGNNVWLEGDSIVSSQGEVVVVRTELTATGDSLFLDSGKGILRMMRNPRINGTKGRPFTLVGETIDLLSRRKKLERVLAKNSAQATSEELTLKADSIDMRLTDDLLQRAVAWGKSRARATSPTLTVVSDSIDVLMPGQRVREVHAVRGASAEGTPDTTHFRTAEKDRLMGDTIIARFDSAFVRDTAAKPRIRQLVSIGHATSLEHFAPRDTACHLPSVNYVRGRLITVDFDSARVSAIHVTDSIPASGVLAEPCATPANTVAGAQAAGARPAGDPRAPGTAAPTTPARSPQSTPPVQNPPAPARPAGSAPAERFDAVDPRSCQ